MGLLLPTISEIVEIIGGPEYLADGVQFVDHRDVITGIYYVERAGGKHEIVRLHYGRHRWFQCLDETIRALGGTVSH